MITILPADEAFLRSISATDGTDAMVLRDGTGAVCGYAQFRMAGDTVEILHVESQEALLVDGLIRSVLNTGDCRGAVAGICRDESLVPVLRRLEFEPVEGVYSVSIEKFFRGDCHCGQEST